MRALLPATALLAFTSIASAQVPSIYTNNFESLVQTDPMALANDGWLLYGGVYDAVPNWLYGHGPWPAVNQQNNWCDLVINEGGPSQGTNQLSVYSDYNNGDHANPGWVLESNVYREWTVTAADVGKTYRFSFDVKRGDLMPPTTAQGFLKLISNTTFNLSGSSLVATEGQPTTWQNLSVELSIDATHVGHWFQLGFLSSCGQYTQSGMIYDNLLLEDITVTAPIGTNYCNVNATSTGQPSIMDAAGSASIAANDLVISCNNIPLNEPGVFFYGASQGQFPFGEGFRCITGSIIRIWPPLGSSGGVLTRAIDYNTVPTAITAGSTWNFQGWFRDPSGGPSGFNLSDGIEITFAP